MTGLNYKDAFYIFINSDERISGTNTNFTVEFPNYSQIIGKSCYACIDAIEAPMGCVYQIESGKNNFAFSVDGISTISFNITPGTYTVTSLTTLLKTQMELLDLNSNTYVFSYNSDTNLISITPTYASGTFELRTVLNDDEINQILGLSSVSNITILSGNTYTFPNQVNMYPKYNFYVCCDIAKTKNIGTGKNNFDNVIHKLHLRDRFVRTLSRIHDFDLYSFYIPSFTSRLRIWIVDENNNGITFPENISFSMSIKIFPI